MRKYYFQLVLSAGMPMNKLFPTAESAEFNLGIKRFVNAKKKSYFCLILNTDLCLLMQLSKNCCRN